MPITTDTINAGNAAAGAFFNINKLLPTMEGASTWHSLWKIAGSPSAAAGANPPAFTAGSGYIPTRATAGSIGQANPAGGNNKYISRLEIQGILTGTLQVYDRLWACSGFNTTTAPGAQSITTPGTLTAGRDPNTGLDVEPWIEIYTAPGATGATWTLTGTDSTGTGGRTWTYCVTPDVECLTRSGWKSYVDCVVGDEIMAYDPETNTTRWSPIREIFADLYTGEMWRLTGRSFDVLTTPNHRWPIELPVGRGRAGWRREVVTSETLPADRGGYILLGADHQGPEQVYPDALVKLAAWVFTEGTVYPSPINRVGLTQSKSVNSMNVDLIRDTLRDLGCQMADPGWSAGPRTANGRGSGHRRRVGLWASEAVRSSSHAPSHECVVWNLHGTGVDALVDCFGPGKDLTDEFINGLTTEQAQAFVWVCLLGDGSAKLDGSVARDNVFWQYDAARMDAFSRVCVLAGYAPMISGDGVSCTVRGLSGRGRRKSLDKVGRTTEQYSGVVWCPRVDEGHWVARRGGRTFITGNTHPANAETIGQMAPMVPGTAIGGCEIPASLTCSVTSGTAGDVGVTLLRRLATIGVSIPNVEATKDAFMIGLPEVYDDACLAFMWRATATTTMQLLGSISIPELTP